MAAVGTMNRRVAHRAGLILLRLVVESGSGRGASRIRGESVAFQADQVYLCALQQARIGRAMWQMASRAAFDLDGFMFVHERAGFVRVALEANQVLRPGRSQLAGLETTMLVMAIGALYESFVHAVMERPVELLLLIQVAAVAKCWLLLFEQKLALFCMVRVVAIRAAHSVLNVDGACEIAVLLSILMAVKAASADLLRRCALEGKNLGLISAALDVSFPWTVASFTTVPLRAFLRIHGSHIVRGVFKVLEEILGRHVGMAGFAGLGTYIERRIRLPHIGLLIGLAGRRIVLRRSSKRCNRSGKQERENDKECNLGLLTLNTHHHPSTRITNILTLAYPEAKARLIPRL